MEKALKILSFFSIIHATSVVGAVEHFVRKAEKLPVSKLKVHL